MGVLGLKLQPLLPPHTDGQDHPPQLTPGRCQPVRRPLTVGLGPDLDHPGPLQLPQTLRQQRPRQPRCAVDEFVERATSQQQVPYDDRGPPLREDLRRPRHRAELAIRPHGPKTRTDPAAATVQNLNLSGPRTIISIWCGTASFCSCSRSEDTGIRHRQPSGGGHRLANANGTSTDSNNTNDNFASVEYLGSDTFRVRT